jgi:competence protein ComEA
MKARKLVTIVTAFFIILGVSSFAAAEKEVAPAKKACAVEGKININTATAKQLTLLPGIGKKTAEIIIEHRTQNGNFVAVDDLLKVKGIGKKTLEKMKSCLAVDGETTLKKVKKAADGCTKH